MKIFSMKSVLAGFGLLALFGYAFVAPQQSIPEEGIAVAQVAALDLTQDQHRADALVDALPMQDVLGTLGPIALSPFFALTCLSGASLLAEAGVLPEGLLNNFMMSSNSPLNNESVFIGLLCLTLLTAAPKLTKVSKPVAQAADLLECYSGIVAAVAVQFLAGIDGGATASPEVAMVYNAGIISVSYSTLLMVFSIINIFVVNTVKFFFEIMIWISPIPFVDAIFESLNKAFVAFLVTLYLFSPFLATVFSMLLFLVALLMFAWTYRRVVFMRCVLGDPMFGWIAEKIFRMRCISENSTRLPKSVSEVFPDATVVIKAFAGKKMARIKKKSRGYLIQSGGATRFVKPRWFGKPRVMELDDVGTQFEIRTGLLSHTLVIRDKEGMTRQKVLFTKRYNKVVERLRELLCKDTGLTDMRSAEHANIGKSFGESIRTADRSELRSELT